MLHPIFLKFNEFLFITPPKLIALWRNTHREEDPNSVWLHYYEEISPPSEVISGENKNVTATDKRCFAYICKFIGLQDRAIKFKDTDYSILLCENVFSQGPGAIYVGSPNRNDIVIDKFCSFGSKTSSDGQFVYLRGDINSLILQGSIYNGGNSSVDAMIYHKFGVGSLSKTNISNCISSRKIGFYYDFADTIVNVSFCSFENLKATGSMITAFSAWPGKIERCNYINNSQDDENSWGLVYIYGKRLDIFDSSFQKIYMVNIILYFLLSMDQFIYIGVVLMIIHLGMMFIHQKKEKFLL